MRDKVSSILESLPEDVKTPIVQKFDLDAAPILTIGVSGRRDAREVTEIAKRRIQEELQTVPGVGSVFLAGGRSRAVNVVIDADRLASYELSVEDVRLALVRQNLEIPGGIVQQGTRELVLRTLGRLKTPEEFDAVIVAYRKGFPIRIRDVGRAEDSFEEPRGLSRLDGRNAVSLFIQKQSGSNTVHIADMVQNASPKSPRRCRPTSRSNDPGPVPLHPRIDGRSEIPPAAGGGPRLRHDPTLHPRLAHHAHRHRRHPHLHHPHLPVHVLHGLHAQQHHDARPDPGGGIVIDDAVVVHENIFRHMEEGGLDAMTASRIGTREIALAVAATSLSLVVIFVPVAFMGGLVAGSSAASV